MKKNGLMFLAWLVLLLSILGAAGLVDVRSSNRAAQVNYLSCIRSNDVRRSQLGEEQYALDASSARRRSAALEARTNPGQQQIDLAAARAFVIDAAHIHIALLDCSHPETAR